MLTEINTNFHIYDVGDGIITCTSAEVWSEDIPTCTPVSCGIPSTLRNAEAEYSATTYLANLTYHCNIGHETEDGHTVQHLVCKATR